jgi:uncharacterized coiled-coil protein SlyX
MQMKGTASRMLLSAIIVAAAVAPAFSQTATSTSADEVNALKEQVAAQQKQIEQLRTTMEEMKQRMDQAAKATPAAPPQTPNLGEVASTTPVVPAAKTEAAAVTVPVASPPASGGVQKEAAVTESAAQKSPGAEVVPSSPLEFHLGNAIFKVGGFLDATAFFRTTNVGSGIGTSFGGIPYSNTVAGRLTETRFSAQNSRLTMMFQTPVGANTNVKAYVEADFLGFQPSNAFETSNSDSFRLRLYWGQVTTGKFEFLAGQTWSFLVPNRVGLSPNPSDLFYTYNMDTNYQVGLPWTRALEFRFIYHASKEWAMGLALEDPQQYIGNAVVLPPTPAGPAPTGTTSTSVYTNQVDNGANALPATSGGTSTPNLFPDVIAKIAYDPVFNGKHMHIEASGVLSQFKLFTPATSVTPAFHETATGGGGSVNFNLEMFKNFHLILNSFFGDGTGRYIFGLGPSLIVKPDGSPGLVHAYSGLGGFEWQPNSKLQLYAYYGGAYFQRNTGIQCFVQPVATPASSATSLATTTPTPVCNSTPSSTPFYVGFGYPGSSSSSNKSLQEPTIGYVQTLWRNPKYGALQIITQYSYVTRAPWFVALNAPKNAHLSMVYADVRYVLP